jgi:hypothetical protein
MRGRPTRRRHRIGLTILCLAAAGPAAAQTPEAVDDDTRLNLTVGADLSTGDYGETRATDIFFVPVAIRLRTGPWRLSASAAWLRVDGPANIVAGDGGGIVTGGTAPARRRDSGFGDVSLGAGYAVELDPQWTVELGGRVKLPTASAAKGLGTGKTDLTLSVDVSRAGRVTPWATVSYRLRGDPAGYDVRNGVDTSLGFAVRAGGSVDLFASYDWSQASSRRARSEHSLFAGATAPLSKRLRLTAYGIAGLSRFAPDAEGGLQLTVRLD